MTNLNLQNQARSCAESLKLGQKRFSVQLIKTSNKYGMHAIDKIKLMLRLIRV